MLDETSTKILRQIFSGSEYALRVNSQVFRAEHYEHLDLIDSLVSSRYIDDRNGEYSLVLTTLLEIADSTPKVRILLDLCEYLFGILREAYRKKPGANISLENYLNSPIFLNSKSIPAFSTYGKLQ